jgi:hypothetical protein
MRRRTLWIIVSVFLVTAVIVAAFLLRRRAAPEPARLLPEADAYFYFNLEPLRTLGVIGKNPPPAQDREYEEFMRETGFQFERDLEEAAFAVHAAPPVKGAKSGPGKPPVSSRRFSEIFRGRFDSQRVANYFRKTAKASENYRDIDIYQVPLEGRTVRVALLGVGLAAVSNTDGPQVLHSMIDRYKKVALPFGGPDLVRQYYRDVPLGSLLWGIARVSGEGEKQIPLMLPGGLDVFFPAETVMVGSVRYTTAIQLKAEAFTTSPEAAKRVVEQGRGFMAIFHSLQDSMNPHGTDQDVKAFFDSLQVQQNKTRAVFSASISPAFLKKIFSEPPTQQILSGSNPPQKHLPAATAPKRRKR